MRNKLFLSILLTLAIFNAAYAQTPDKAEPDKNAGVYSSRKIVFTKENRPLV